MCLAVHNRFASVFICNKVTINVSVLLSNLDGDQLGSEEAHVNVMYAMVQQSIY